MSYGLVFDKIFELWLWLIEKFRQWFGQGNAVLFGEPHIMNCLA